MMYCFFSSSDFERNVLHTPTWYSPEHRILVGLKVVAVADDA
jgi:hypothetical protein